MGKYYWYNQNIFRIVKFKYQMLIKFSLFAVEKANHARVCYGLV